MTRKTVLLLGDSISLGYRQKVRSILKDSLSVVYPKEQGKNAADLYRMIYEWSRDLIDDLDDVGLIYWNAGLWDVVNIFGEGPNTDVETYQTYLNRTVKRLRKLFPRAKICFALTTPVLEERYKDDFYRTNEEIKKYNRAADKVLREQVDFVDDLYSLVNGTEKENYIDATHFTNTVNQQLAVHISNEIKSLLHRDIEEYGRLKQKREIKKERLLAAIADNRRIQIAAWGAGNIFSEYKDILKECCDILAVIDRDRRLQGSKIHGYPCIAAGDIPAEAELVVITVDNTSAILEIQDYCFCNEINCCTCSEIMERIWPVYEKKVFEKVKPVFKDVWPGSKSEMKKYIGISIPENICNLDCMYCYLQLIPYRRYININRKNPHSAKFIRWRLRREVLGGSCLIGLTGAGETLFADHFEEVCLELLKEGHYLHIVTNGIPKDKIERLLDAAGDYAGNIIFKLSFHYLQLLEKKMLPIFVETVRLIEASLASYTIEVMPHDELIPYIQEILDFSLHNFGAYPHLTIGRDEKDGAKLLTKQTYTQFYHTWKVFESVMFDMRMDLYMRKGKNCQAGEKSLFMDLYTGRLSRCIFPESIGNAYFDGIENLNIAKVGDYCPMNYCFNCHVYAALGVLPVSDVPTYMTIRDRKKEDGSHWIKENMRRYLNIKL